MIKRVELEEYKHPNFIGCWNLENDSLCDGIIEFFEKNRTEQRSGKAGSKGKADPLIKSSTDISIQPKDLEKESHRVLSEYMEKLNECFLDYLEQWEFLKSFLNRVYIGMFNIQKYDTGGHFNTLHSERTNISSLQRILVWMTYLNDMPNGGETEFPFFDLKITPEKGKTLIWPAEWTHAHRGTVVNEGPKFIITGWMHFPEYDEGKNPSEEGD
jgi:hypothetical protein